MGEGLATWRPIAQPFALWTRRASCTSLISSDKNQGRSTWPIKFLISHRTSIIHIAHNHLSPSFRYLWFQIERYNIQKKMMWWAKQGASWRAEFSRKLGKTMWENLKLLITSLPGWPCCKLCKLVRVTAPTVRTDFTESDVSVLLCLGIYIPLPITLVGSCTPFCSYKLLVHGQSTTKCLYLEDTFTTNWLTQRHKNLFKCMFSSAC